ncbi:Clavaminate synthase-like protein [Aulographum hederae CBS 113979]|uniref:Clavaminate synthase-like protein n=1 Tax=Aulographum hederae CBS 113979 TaxID=1176131 RepID=A0A6G1H919_9PEZI|nr:Clavaminate synthase-like protein [Aulographum hederae CBS 113979]
MAPSAVPVRGYSNLPAETEESLLPSRKRLKTHHGPTAASPDIQPEEDAPAAIPPHPLGIKPSGNAYTSSVDHKAAAGNFAKLPDELLIQLLELLEAPDLIRLGQVCKALYAFTRAEELWKALFVESLPKDFTWCGTWRATSLRIPAEHESHIHCPYLFSDALYRPYFCAHTDLWPFAKNIPKQNEISRLSDLSLGDYQLHWTSKPFILTDPVKEWPVFKEWDSSALLDKYSTTAFRAEAVDWPLHIYVDYMNNNTDESPLYLFDRAFATKMFLPLGTKASGAAYWAPPCLGEDLFSVLGDQRPDSRWLIMGPARSGSTFHKDPNATSAWNAVITGSKYWLMFPSSSTLPPPPGVILSEDQSEVTSPLSIAEYLLSFHSLARQTPGCREGICHAGEVLHVPSGWFHLVLNLEAGIALTQNFVPRGKLGDVLKFLRDCPDQVSGFRDEVVDPYGLFVDRLGNEFPEILQEGMRALEGKRGKWEELTKEDEEDQGGFSFGFGGGDSDDEEDE